MKILLWLVLASVEIFSSSHQLSDPEIKAHAAGISQRFPKEYRETANAKIVELIKKTDPNNVENIIELIADTFNDNKDKINISFVEGVFFGFNAGLNQANVPAAAQFTAPVPVPSSLVSSSASAPPPAYEPQSAPSSLASSSASSTSPTNDKNNELVQRRSQEFMNVVKDLKNLGQLFESLEPYIKSDIAKLESLLREFPHEKMDDAKWKNLLDTIPESMNKGGISGPARFGKAIALIDSWKESLLKK